MTKPEDQRQSALLKDISNYRTPKRPPKTPGFQTPYTASVFRSAKQNLTPGSASASLLRRRSVLPSAAKSTVARRLKEIELEQSQLSRKAQVYKERSLKSLSKSLTAWLNFLFENPRGCGCERLDGGGVDVRHELVNGNRKRDSMEGHGSSGFGVDEEWRNPKRSRDYEWSSLNADGGELLNAKMFSALRGSLKEVCSFDDLLLRMRAYLSLDSCKEVFSVMTKVTKAIDEGRLKMKAHCPLVTDFGMKEKAIQTLLCYNPIWLRIGLHIIFGGDSLLPNGDVSADLENGLLKMVIEKQFFSHAGLAKVYAYNKNVEGIYRPGYYEKLGTVILKRFLLFALILDRAKNQRTLPLKFGIDGIDGGSPLLFNVNSDVKASRQMVNEFLSTNVMHGEGNLVAHLEMIRFKVTYQQEPLLEHRFRVLELFEDLQDGVLICRVIQLLQHDSSILMRLAVPSDSPKKKLSNCSLVLQYLKQAGVPLLDDDGVSIVSEDIALGDKELTLSLLWNIFVHLQIPLLVKKSLFLEEITKISGTVDVTVTAVADPLALLLSWAQAVCEKYNCQVDNFSSLVDGKVMWCLLDYYFRKELHCSRVYKDLGDQMAAESIVSALEYTDGVHNFVMLQKLTTLLGNFPEVLQISELLEYNAVCNERSVIMLLVFLSSELIVKRNMDQLNFHKLLGCSCQSVDRKRASLEQLCPAKNVPPTNSLCCVRNDEFSRNFQEIKAWWQDVIQKNKKHEDIIDIGLANDVVNFTVPMPESTKNENTTTRRENAVRVIQSFHRQSIARKNYIMLKDTAFFLQVAVRAWLAARNHYSPSYSSHNTQRLTLERSKGSERFQTYFLFMEARHKFVMLKRSAVLIQRAVRTWISCRQFEASSELCRPVVQGNAVIIIQSHVRRWLARRRFSLKKKLFCNERHAVNVIQRKFRRFKLQKAEQINAATLIQSQFRRWIFQREYHRQRHLIIIFQSNVRVWLSKRKYKIKRKSAVKIQSLWRAHKTRLMYICHRKAQQLQVTKKAAIIIQSQFRRWIVQTVYHRQRHLVIILQSNVRAWLSRRTFSIKRQSAIKIQSLWRAHKTREMYTCYRRAVTNIQSVVRGQISRKRLLGSSNHYRASSKLGFMKSCSISARSFELDVIIMAILKLQRWWREVLSHRLKKDPSIIIQAHVRGWLARRRIAWEMNQVVLIQSHWKGYLARKGSKQDLIDLRSRVKQSAANIDDSKRLMNRLLAALAELLSMKSIRNILHTCETLDTATKHSQKCCEELVAAGAINTLLKLIQSVSRSIPDQEVLKYSLSTLRNLARYPNLTKSIISANRSVEIILLEMLRNKEDAYFTAAELMTKICSIPEGIKAVHSLPGFVKRLHNYIEDLKRKISFEKRNQRANLAPKETMERRLHVALEILKIATCSR